MAGSAKNYRQFMLTSMTPGCLHKICLWMSIIISYLGRDKSPEWVASYNLKIDVDVCNILICCFGIPQIRLNRHYKSVDQSSGNYPFITERVPKSLNYINTAF